MIGLFCRISSLFKGSFAKETCNSKEPTNRRHPIPDNPHVQLSVSTCMTLHVITYMDESCNTWMSHVTYEQSLSRLCLVHVSFVCDVQCLPCIHVHDMALICDMHACIASMHGNVYKSVTWRWYVTCMHALHAYMSHINMVMSTSLWHACHISTRHERVMQYMDESCHVWTRHMNETWHIDRPCKRCCETIPMGRLRLVGSFKL